MIKLVKKQTLLLALVISPFIAFSQETDDPGWGEGDIDGQTLSDIPVDGGICFLLATGAIIGIKQLRKRKTGIGPYDEVE
jgi:hypothetical protein